MEHAASMPRILLADDDPTARDVFRSALDRLGWSCECVADGELALRALTNTEFDIIVTDIMMPGIDGVELIRRIRAQHPSQAVIVVSGQQSVTRISEFIREGAVDFIEKPLRFAEIKASLTRVLAAVRQEAARRGIYEYLRFEHSRFFFTSREFSEVKFALPILERLYQCGRIDLTTRLRLELAFQEAICNAYEHGNLELQSQWREEIDSDGRDRYSREKRARLMDDHFGLRTLEIESRFGDGVLEVRVSDSGNGFDPAVIARTPDGEPRPHGRGLSIIYATMDAVGFVDHGRSIVMRKRLS